MTDRLKGLTVAFEKDIRDDEAKCVIDAILMIKGVAAVTTSISNSEDYMNRQQIKRDVIDKIYALAKEI
jgi:hypothetical protein